MEDGRKEYARPHPPPRERYGGTGPGPLPQEREKSCTNCAILTDTSIVGAKHQQAGAPMV